ncbi:hypothetical protein [Aquimarina hainanensis]
MLALIVGASNLQSCKSSQIVRLSNEKYEETNVNDIDVFSSQKPTKDYVEIAKVSTDKFSKLGAIKHSGETINKRLKEKAASVGGHAIINLTEDFASVSGTVIRYKK